MLENLDFKQGIAGKVSCSSSLSGEGHLAVSPPDLMTTLRWHKRGQGEENSMVDDVCRNQPSSHLAWATVSDEPKSVLSISTMSSHRYKQAPAVPAALSTTSARTNSTNGTQRGAMSGEMHSSSKSSLSESQPEEAADNLSVRETIVGRGSVVSRAATDSVGENDADTVKMQSSLSALGQQARRLTSGRISDRWRWSTCLLTAKEIRDIIRNHRQHTLLSTGEAVRAELRGIRHQTIF